MLKSKDKKPDIKKIVSKMGIVFVLIALIILWSVVFHNLPYTSSHTIIHTHHAINLGP